jgi:hypothetical protein
MLVGLLFLDREHTVQAFLFSLFNSGEALVAALPLLLLLAALLVGWYPGCETVVRLSLRRSGSPRRRSVPRRLRPVPPPLFAASGGLLLGSGLARRPPPLASFS